MKEYPDDYDLSKIEWCRYKIIVPTEQDRLELMEAFEHIHCSDIDTNFIVINQLAHEYLDNSRIEGAKNNIIVDEAIYEALKDK